MMDFRVLGPVEVAAGERRTEISSGQRRTLLAVLLANSGCQVTTDALIEALWPSDPPPSARKTLQSHLSRLRGELRDLADHDTDPLIGVAAGYRLDIEGHALDAERFTGDVMRARQVAADDPRLAADLLAAALGRWRGRAFGELADHPAVRPDAVRLERLRAAATAELVDAKLALGRPQEVLAELEAAVERDPLDERAHAQLMLAQFRTGRQVEALATYRRLRDRLRDEAGVDPSPGVSDLHEKILRQDPEVARTTGAHASPRDVVPVGPPNAEVVAGRPTPRADAHTRRGATDLVGRTEAVTALARLVGTCSLVTLTGPGGVGKTRLADQVADALAPTLDDGVAVCALAGVRDPQAVGGALITTLGVQPTGDATAEQTLVSVIGERRLLLLLDNCEHLLATVAAYVATIRDHCPNVTVLATSRERLHLPDERVWQVAPLEVPAATSDPAEVAATPAGELFRARAAAADGAFELTVANAGAVAQLCRRLDGMPLAIELAAARSRALPPQELVTRLDQRFSLLAGGPLHEAGRHRTLQAVVEWSYDLLDDDEATLFDRLSVFAGAFSLEAAEHVCADAHLPSVRVAGLLGELVDKSMVTVEHRDDLARYRLLDTLRTFGAGRLQEVGETTALRRTHARYHVELARRLGPQVRGAAEREAVTAIDAALDDLRAAHAWLVAEGDLDGALDLPAALGDDSFFRLRDEVTTWVRRALELPGATDHPRFAGALATSARGATSRGETARAHREGAIALERAHDEDLARLWALEALSTSALYEGRLDELLEHVEELHAQALAREEPYSRAFAGVCRVIGHAYRGEAAAATACLPELMAAAQGSASPTMLAFAHYCDGECHLDTDPARATASLEWAIELAHRVDNALIEGVSQVSLASLLGRRGHTEQALRRFRTVIAHWRRLGNYTHQLTTLRNLVELLVQLGDDEPAAMLYGAVTDGRSPTFGLEAERLATAWERLESRLGEPAAAAAARRGRGLTPTGVAGEILQHLDAQRAD